MNLSIPLQSEEEYQLALVEFKEQFQLDSCCTDARYGLKLFDRIKEYEATEKIAN